MQPKCKLCGSRQWRLVREVVVGKETLFFYQCRNNHIHILDSPVQETGNPLLTVPL